jgi:hypothetical protein
MKLPPRQALVAPGKWPLVGEAAPRPGTEPWTVSVTGLVARPWTFTLDEIRALPNVERAVDIHCVTRWSKPGARFGGVPLRALLEPSEPRSEARFVSFVARSTRGHSTSLPLADALALETLVALTYEGQPLAETHGGPVRTVVPGRYFYKSLKWLETIELLARDRLGTWEAGSGYHNGADPWREERYIAAGLDGRETKRLLESRDVSGRDLLGLEAGGLDLTGFRAAGALLRNAGFVSTRLANASFEGANLSNARFVGSDLRGASFRGADLEGADFRAADLRNADFRGASLFGATFCAEPGEEEWGAATLDGSTRLERDQAQKLGPVQQRFLADHLPGWSRPAS